MIESDYLLAWSAYGVAALGCLLVWCRLTRWMWRYLREPLRLLVAVLLLSPTIVDPARELFAPAIAITALDLLFKVGNNAWRAVADLALYGLIALALYLLFVAIRWPIERWWKRRGGAAPAAREEDGPTLRELMEQDAGEQPAAQRDSRGERRLRIEPRL
ncbi:MFS transporter [Pseudomonas benzenivorans]|uniref:MFS transporter n=1 Tax=Pseudomonas benzenivorans TaxID=556533 RepID=A0ABY5HA49_9PSED|nr:MFS transporter [Pseudomonas benzenivorans]UTW08493.1 MFS transporter [Pseudomonas benzenivorans]